VKKRAFTNADGYYEITDIEPGAYWVIAIKRGYKAGFAKVTVETGKTTRKDFQLQSKSGKYNPDKVAALYSNYPNPFNPETWIPYCLPQDADVTIRIYNNTGQLIRALNPGRQAAGIYLDKDQAAYWDGRDGLGEKVASGVYFYTLQVRHPANRGEFKATRRMVVLK
jgi:hypothetical protein